MYNDSFRLHVQKTTCLKYHKQVDRLSCIKPSLLEDHFTSVFHGTGQEEDAWVEEGMLEAQATVEGSVVSGLGGTFAWHVVLKENLKYD